MKPMKDPLSVSPSKGIREPHEVKIPFTRANAQWVFHGFHIALKFTLQNYFSVLPFVFIVLHSTTFIYLFGSLLCWLGTNE